MYMFQFNYLYSYSDMCPSHLFGSEISIILHTYVSYIYVKLHVCFNLILCIVTGIGVFHNSLRSEIPFICTRQFFICSIIHICFNLIIYVIAGIGPSQPTLEDRQHYITYICQLYICQIMYTCFNLIIHIVTGIGAPHSPR